MRSGILKLMALAMALALVGVACERDGDEDGGDAGQQAEANLLEEIIDRGTLRCGVNETVPGFGFDPGTGEIEGFDIDFCRAFAAAIVGDAEAVELFPIDADFRFSALRDGEYDVLVRNTTWTTSRDGAEGVAFAHPNFYDGQAMMVRTGEFGAIDEMGGTAICVTTGTTTELNLADYFQELGLEFEAIGLEDNEQLQRAFIQERCDAWTSDRSQLAGIRSAWPQRAGGPEALTILDEVMSKEPLAPGVLDTQIELHDAIDAVVNGLILAEELGVNSGNVDQLAQDPETGNPIAGLLGLPVLDPETGESAPIDHGLGLPQDFMIRAIQAVGNYGQIFNRHVGPDSPLGLERGVNDLWTRGGIQYAIPFR